MERIIDNVYPEPLFKRLVSTVQRQYNSWDYNNDFGRYSKSTEEGGAFLIPYLNKSVEVTFKDPTLYYVENFIYVQESKFKGISGFESLLNEGTIEYIDTFKSSGTQISKDLTSNNRVGVFTVKGYTKEETIEKVQKAVQEIEVYDVNDQPIMNKDIYQNLKTN